MRRQTSNVERKSEPSDVEHELPPAEQHGENEKQGQAAPSGAASTTSDVEKLKAERDTLVDRMARMQAEFENARKRAQQQQQEFKQLALSDALKSLLPILDSFDRAVEAPTRDLEEFRSGVELIRKQLHDAMSKLGLRAVPAAGQPFDPNLHEAVEMVESPEADHNRVLEELQRGYKLGPRLLRPAMVRVAQNPEKK